MFGIFCCLFDWYRSLLSVYQLFIILSVDSWKHHESNSPCHSELIRNRFRAYAGAQLGTQIDPKLTTEALMLMLENRIYRHCLISLYKSDRKQI